MYLAKYIIIAVVFAAALLFVIRTCSYTSVKEWRGKLARVLLSVLLLSFVVVIWYYATEENFGTEYKWIEPAVRTVSSVLYIVILPDIWADRDKALTKAAEEKSNGAAKEAEES